MFLDALAKLRKATISFVMSVRLSVRMNFNEILYLKVFRKSVGKIKVTSRPNIYRLSCLAHFFLE
jgi:hypothetical protein